MSNKTKNNSIKQNITRVAQGLGVVAMTGAMAIVTAEVGGIHPPKAELSKDAKDKQRIVLPAPAEPHAPKGGGHGAAEARPRHTEEVGPHHISYGSMQRTPSRAGAM